MKIVVMVDGQPKGPFELEALRGDLQQGRISPTALAWHEGRDGWVELQQMLELGVSPKSMPNEVPQQQTGVMWFYLSGNQHAGPVTQQFLEDALAKGTILGTTHVWREGMTEWTRANECPNLSASISSSVATTDSSKAIPAFPSPPPDGSPNSAPPPVKRPSEDCYASLGWRLLAGLIDYAILFIPAMMANLLGAVLLGPDSLLGSIPSIGVFWLYDALFMSSSWQATLGMRILKLDITDINGARLSFGRASGRYFASLLSAVLCFAGFLMIPFTPKRQGLHDIIAQTVVFKRVKPAS